MELKKLGKVLKLKIFEKHPDGVVQIKFSQASEAEQCIQVMHNRLFDGFNLTCEYWDG